MQGSEPLHPLHFGPSRVDVQFFRQLQSGCNTYSTGMEWMYTRGFISGFISGILRLFTTPWGPIQPHFQRLTLTIQPIAAVMNRRPRWRYPHPPIAILPQQAPARRRLESYNRHQAYFQGVA
jgi:hypothetical protein